jgi:hypothetical protein
MIYYQQQQQHNTTSMSVSSSSSSSLPSSLPSPLLSLIQSLAVAKQSYLAFPHVEHLLMPASTLIDSNHDDDSEAHVAEPETTSLDCFVAAN